MVTLYVNSRRITYQHLVKTWLINPLICLITVTSSLIGLAIVGAAYGIFYLGLIR